MNDRERDEMMDAVRAWQHNPRVTPLRCGQDVAHRRLEPIVDEGRVILRCPDCDYTQHYVPSSVMHAFRTAR